MRLLFFFLIFTFDYLFFAGLPLYILVFPFLKGSVKNVVTTYLTDRSIRKIAKAIFIYSIILLGISIFHNEIDLGVRQIFLLNMIILVIGIELYSYARSDHKLKGYRYLLIIFGVNSVVAILQSLQIDYFWRLPETIGAIFNAGLSDNKYFGFDFVEFNRVRGLFLLIHKFSPAIIAGSIFFYYRGYQSKNRILLYALATIMLFAAILTQTRSILVGLLVGILISTLYIFKNRKRKFLVLMGFLILIIGFLSLDFSNEYFERLYNFNLSSLSNNDSYRLKGVIYSIEKFIDNPLIGDAEKLMIDNNEAVTVHGVMFRILGDYGIIGILSYFIMIKIILSQFLKDTSRIFKSLLAVVFSIFFVDGLTHSSGFMFYDVFQFSFLMLIYGYSRNKQLNNE